MVGITHGIVGVNMVEVKYIYTHQGKPVNEYTIRNGKFQVSMINLGATLTKMVIRNRFRKYESVHLRFHDYRKYRLDGHPLTSWWCERGGVLTPLSAVYFEAEFIENGIRFTSLHPAYPLTIDYRFIDYTLSVQAYSKECYHFNLYVNLSGNLKRDTSAHQCKVDNLMIDLFNPVIDEPFQANETFFIMDMENGAKLDFHPPIHFILNNRVQVDPSFRFNKGLSLTEHHMVKMQFSPMDGQITVDLSH